MKDIVDEHYQLYKETRRGLEVFAKLLLPEEVEVVETSDRESRPLLEQAELLFEDNSETALCWCCEKKPLLLCLLAKAIMVLKYNLMTHLGSDFEEVTRLALFDVND